VENNVRLTFFAPDNSSFEREGCIEAKKKLFVGKMFPESFADSKVMATNADAYHFAAGEHGSSSRAGRAASARRSLQRLCLIHRRFVHVKRNPNPGGLFTSSEMQDLAHCLQFCCRQKAITKVGLWRFQRKAFRALALNCPKFCGPDSIPEHRREKTRPTVAHVVFDEVQVMRL
jgi:hypothetical protein